MQYGNPYVMNPFMQQVQQAMQPIQQQVPVMQQQAGIAAKVDGPNEAMNRFLMLYPASQLIPGFISDPLFDINGRQFHALSIEPDGRRNLETFDYTLHQWQQPQQSDGYVSREEFQQLVDKVNQMTGGTDGIHEPVQAAATE